MSSPLLEASIEGARGILLNVSGPSDLGLFELNEAAEIIGQSAHPDANIIFGAVVDEGLGDELRVTVIATGFGDAQRRRRRQAPTAEPRTTRETAPVPAPAGAREERSSESFEIPDEVLDVPAFLRDS